MSDIGLILVGKNKQAYNLTSGQRETGGAG